LFDIANTLQVLNLAADKRFTQMKTLLFLTLIVSFSVMAQDQGKLVTGYDIKTDVIADNYEAGSYLIYDCKERHWTCVLEEYYKECTEKRENDRLSLDEPYHSCAPIEKLSNKRSCFQRQLYLTANNYGERFCIKDSWKEKNIDF
jgi:hypothetical protein